MGKAKALARIFHSLPAVKFRALGKPRHESHLLGKVWQRLGFFAVAECVSRIGGTRPSKIAFFGARFSFEPACFTRKREICRLAADRVPGETRWRPRVRDEPRSHRVKDEEMQRGRCFALAPPAPPEAGVSISCAYRAEAGRSRNPERPFGRRGSGSSRHSFSTHPWVRPRCRPVASGRSDIAR